jgi:hypothetical protein
MLLLGSDKRHQHIYLESHPANHGRGLATPIFRHFESRFEFVDAEFAVIEFQGQVTEFKARVFDMDISGLYQDIGVHFFEGIERQGIIRKQTQNQSEHSYLK